MMTSTGYHHRCSGDQEADVPPKFSTLEHTVPYKPLQSKHNSRKQKPTPFDPNDLCRRLQIVLAEEKAYADRKRRSRASIDRATTLPLPDEYGKRKGREMPFEIAVNQATATKSAQVTAARRSLLSASPTKCCSKGPVADADDSQQLPEAVTLSYHHVPCVAAAQFVRTTTLESAKNKPLVHKFSKKAMKFHMEGLNSLTEVEDGVAPDEQVRTLHRVRSERERTYGRNQFQHPASILEAPDNPDDTRDHEEAYRHTFDTHFRVKQSGPDEIEEEANSRLSTIGARVQQSVAQESSKFTTDVYPVLPHDSGDHQDMLYRIEAHRVDWTQSDEKPFVPLSLELRKTGSKRTLRGRLGFQRSSKNGNGDFSSEDHEASPALRSQTSSLFARFRC